ncbi:uncharacterized protein DUF3810 [Thermoflavifilum aggregans]|uniref:Uncharacterized protein DUF3810 n=1 Tax=Thermoflavifilum aggregans TaxID=454188 RepID=A0A2M9CVF1_9BACT|nr:DUF3810 domain-containing protein [Thermoflavifilum aggregans]PJJ75890.1 uncharacterized protein DUF3810 [Thermoflavifilum aggregans]
MNTLVSDLSLLLRKCRRSWHTRWQMYAFLGWLGLIALGWSAWLFIPGFHLFWLHELAPTWWQFQRLLTGWVPFSLGDLGYVAVLLWLLWQIYAFIRSWISKGMHFRIWSRLLGKIVLATSLMYGWFQLGWGFAYLLPRIQQSFHLQLKSYSHAELQDLARWLAAATNAYYVQQEPESETHRIAYFRENIVPKAMEAYHQLHLAGMTGTYHHPSIKPSLFRTAMNYMGIEGYYNPFTGEAQVNTDIPPVLLPFVTCHEMAHQMGFAQEYAANFVGFLAATHARDSLFRYSAYLDMLLYAFNSLRHYGHADDSLFLHQLWESLLPGVKQDIKSIYAYEQAYAGPADRLMMHVYDVFLKANQQRRGIHSYQQVIALLIQYRKEIKEHG